MESILGSLAVIALPTFVIPFVLTLLVEVPVGALFLRVRGRWLTAVVAVNVITNPPLNLIVSLVYLAGSQWALIAILVLEAAVVLIEWRLLRWSLGLPSRRALASAVTMNALSFAFGLVRWIGTGGLLGF